MEHEEAFLRLLQNASVNTRRVNQRSIRGWFDTDCKDLLTWICTYVTPENCVSKQEQQEFAALDYVLSGEKLEEKIESLNMGHTNFLESDSNLLEIRLSEDLIDLYEEQLKHCQSQIKLNNELTANLGKENIEVNLNKCQSQENLQDASETCLKSCKTSHVVQSNIYEQLLTLSSFINQTVTIFPQFVNTMDFAEFEEKFNTQVRLFDLKPNNMQIYFGNKNELLQNFTNRVFAAKQNELLSHMEVEGFYRIKSLLEPRSFTYIQLMDAFTLELNVEKLRSIQKSQVSEMSKELIKYVANIINPLVLLSLEDEFNHYLCVLENLDKLVKILEKLLTSFNIFYNLGEREIEDSKSFQQKIYHMHKYVNNTLARDKMRDLSSFFSIFSQQPLEQKIQILENFSTIVCGRQNSSLGEILKTLTANTRKKIQLEDLANCQQFFGQIERICKNLNILNETLIAGPTGRIVLTPLKLQQGLSSIDQSLLLQERSIKSILVMFEFLRGNLKHNKDHRLLGKLWKLYLTDSHKMKSWLKQLST